MNVSGFLYNRQFVSSIKHNGQKENNNNYIFLMLPNIWACCYEIALNLGYFSSLGIFILKKILERYKEVNFFSPKMATKGHNFDYT